MEDTTSSVAADKARRFGLEFVELALSPYIRLNCVKESSLETEGIRFFIGF